MPGHVLHEKKIPASRSGAVGDLMLVENLCDAVQEVRELGLSGALFRASWEIRSRLTFRAGEEDGRDDRDEAPSETDIKLLPFADPITVASALSSVIPEANLYRLRHIADEATSGRVLCFGRWTADFGSPIRWHDDPLTGKRRDPRLPSRIALADQESGDIKTNWEVARFPHAYHLARAAAFFPSEAERYAASLAAQIRQFATANPKGRGINWASGQEISFRLLSWLFASPLLSRSADAHEILPLVGRALFDGAVQIEKHLDYARKAVYNNHLLSEAVGLLAAGILLPRSDRATQWRRTARNLLDEQATRQIYDDGGYIQQSHNYHRVAIQDYLWACLLARAEGTEPSVEWLEALDRSLTFLIAHQNPIDGRLPNYGANDGALPSLLSTCDFSDMRPTLQSVSLLVRQERAYDRGPWDEEAAWWLGIGALDAPLKSRRHRSQSFAQTGYHVLRGRDPSSFAAFRCGTLRDRFSQIDMLHVDIWWRGLNVLVDPGSYRYNAARPWHEHFTRTACHNTVQIDGRDQMLHYRPFKVLYWTKASLLRFEDTDDLTICEGEHYGYRRQPGGCVHRRTVIFCKDDLWIVIDRIAGKGAHHARLQWLAGEFPWTPTLAGMEITTPEGPFLVSVRAQDGSALSGDVRAGVESPPRGWLSRYYGEKVPVPSLVVEQNETLPVTFVTVLSGTSYDLNAATDQWRVRLPDRELLVTFGDRIEARFASA